MSSASSYRAPIAIPYSLNYIGHQKLFAENEELKRRNLEMQLGCLRPADSASAKAEIDRLKADLDHLKAVALERRQEVEQWQEATRGQQNQTSNTEQLDYLKTQVERSVCDSLDKVMRAKTSEYSRDMIMLKAENAALVKSNVSLLEQLQRLKADGKIAEVRYSGGMDNSISAVVRDQAIQLHDTHAIQEQKFNIEVANIKNQIACLTLDIQEKENNIRRLNREYVEKVVVKKESETSAIEERYQTDYGLAKIEHHRAIDDIASGNAELRKKIAELERVLSKQRIDNAAELDHLKSSLRHYIAAWQDGFKEALRDESETLRNRQQNELEEYASEISLLKQKLIILKGNPTPETFSNITKTK